MLVELDLFVVLTSCTDWLTLQNMCNTNSKTWLGRVYLLLCMFFMLLALIFNFFHSLLEHFFKFCLAAQLFVVLQTARFQKFPLVIQSHFKFLDQLLIPENFFLLSFHFANWNKLKWAIIQIRCRMT